MANVVVITKAGKPIHVCKTEKDAERYLDEVEAKGVSDNRNSTLKATIIRYNSLWLDICPHEYKCYTVTSNMEL